MSDRLYKSINKNIGKAIFKYNMISDGDCIAVGVSGGKDSLTLMWALSERLNRIPVNYKLFAIHIDLGFDDNNSVLLKEYCRLMGYEIIIEHTDYGIKSHSSFNKENPCFLCSKLRRKRLFEIADELNCNKLAFGHHKDDIIETLFLNMCYAGSISTMVPNQTFFNGKFKVIRPLAFTDEKAIIAFSKKQDYPILKEYCPTSKVSKRKEIKDILSKLYMGNKNVKSNIFKSLSNVNLKYML